MIDSNGRKICNTIAEQFSIHLVFFPFSPFLQLRSRTALDWNELSLLYHSLLNYLQQSYKMAPSSRLFSLLTAFLWLANEAGSMPTCKPGNEAAATVGKAIYFLTNDKANAVVAVPIGNDGTLSKGAATMTGGAGSVGVDAQGQPATPDALISQSSLTVAGNVSR